MPSRKDTNIHRRKAQGRSSPSNSSPHVRDQDPTYSFGSEEGEIVKCASACVAGGASDQNLMKEVEDFVESVRKEVAQEEARKVSAAISRERRPAPLYTHLNAGMAMGNADPGNLLAILQPRKAFRSSTLYHKINTCGGRRRLLRSTGMAYRLGDREIARVIEELTKNAKQLTVRVVIQYDIDRAVKRTYAWKRREGVRHFRHWNNC